MKDPGLFFFGGTDHAEESVAEKDHNPGKDHNIGGEDPENGGAFLKKVIADINKTAPTDHTDKSENDQGNFFLLGSHDDPK
jgi:hypothetical protein